MLGLSASLLAGGRRGDAPSSPGPNRHCQTLRVFGPLGSRLPIGWGLFQPKMQNRGRILTYEGILKMVVWLSGRMGTDDK